MGRQVSVPQTGFTLIEIAIALVIIGLLVGTVLRGQDLVVSGRVRNLIAQQEGIRAAVHGFQDRFRAYPGDHASASDTLRCPALATCLNGNGNGNGVVERVAVPSGGSEANESLLVWMHLTASGFLSGSYAMSAGETAPTDLNTPRNPYNTYLQLAYDRNFADAAPSPPNRHNLKTGPQIPVAILAEVDRKTDDGNGLNGAFRFSTFGDTASGGNAQQAPLAPAATHAPGRCASTTGVWFTTADETNCGAANLL